MSESAATPTLGEPANGGPTSVRERLGVGLFIVVSVVATVGWISLLAWGVLKLLGAT
jgi:hypothetical protein